MKELTAPQKTMTLKEITDLLKIRHDKAMDIVTKMAESPEFGTVSKIDIVYNKQGQTVETYQLDKRQSIAVSAKLNTTQLMRVIDRWQELETKQAFQLPNFEDPAEAAIAWASEFKQKQALQITVDAQTETIKIKDDLIRVSNEASIKAGEILISEFVKTHDFIPVGRNQFYAWMRETHLCFSERNEPYQKFVTAGYFTYRPTEELHGGKYRYILRVTPRGKVWLAAKYLVYLDSVGFDVPIQTTEPRNGLVSMQ